MPDTFFRKFLYGAAAMAVGAGVTIVAGKFASSDSALQADFPASLPPVAERTSTHIAPPEWKSDLYTSEPVAESAGADSYLNVRAHLPMREERPRLPVAVAPAYAAPAQEPVMRFGNEAVDFIVPIDLRSGQEAVMPVALALAIDPTGVPDDVREAVREMAMDFLDSMKDSAAVATTDPQSPEYYRRWEAATLLSDRNFKMRYGRVAYVQMNMMAGQEAAAVR